jgi:hypothetical protein
MPCAIKLKADVKEKLWGWWVDETGVVTCPMADTDTTGAEVSGSVNGQLID